MNVEANTSSTSVSSESGYTASISDWIQRVPSASSLSATPGSSEEMFLHGSKRRRGPSSTPSEFLGDKALYSKKHKSSMTDMDAAGRSTPSTAGSRSSETKLLTGTSRTVTSVASSDYNPQTPKRRKKGKKEIGFRMQAAGLHQEDAAYDAAESFKQFVTELVVQSRGSEKKTDWVPDFNENHKAYRGSSERTFLHHIVPILQGKGYHVSVNPNDHEELDREAQEWKTFLGDEQAVYALDQDFSRTLLPKGFLDNDPELLNDMVKSLAKDAHMKDPRPDWVFGLQRDKFPVSVGASFPEHILELLDIVPTMHHPFLILEGKSNKGDMTAAENQACRGGATLVRAIRALRTELQIEKDNQGATLAEAYPQTPRPDYKSFVFSITMSPQVFQVNVHWVDEATGYFHMNCVDSYALKNLKGPIEIRSAMHNIFEWGLRHRSLDLEEVTEAINSYTRRLEQGQPNQILAAGVDTGKADARPGKRKREERNVVGDTL